MHHQSKKWQVSAVLLLTFFLSSCSLGWLDNYLPQQTSSDPQETLVEITFRVTVPHNTPENETIFLSVLDEVTGLGVNAQAYPLSLETDLENPEAPPTYTAVLQVPLHTTLKYRYTRINQYAIIEHTGIDQQVRYRIAQADSSQEIKDVVNRWSDKEYIWPEPGRISGTITDEVTGEPLPGVLVAAGGLQTHTTATGSFLLSGLPPGVHNLVAYSMNGDHQTMQQGAEVASQANTEANLALTPSQFVDVTFIVTVPYGTPEKSVKIAGNLYQLGNTFGNLSGGMNTIPDRMPVLAHAGDNRYGVILSLPTGTEIKYKYTLGDGFWNAEHDGEGSFRVRRLIVPDQPLEVHDQVETWSSGAEQAVTFDLRTPETTPPNENIYIQFNPYGWTTPLPMMKIEEHHWVFILYSPFDIISDLTYRYCRAGECGTADDLATSENAEGRSVSPNAEPQYLADTVQDWIWFEEEVPDLNLSSEQALDARSGFFTAVELMPDDDPAYSQDVIPAVSEISNMNAGWVVLTPTWSMTHQNPPVLEPNANRDPLWFDLASASTTAQNAGLKTAVHPQPYFSTSPNEWWKSAQRDFSWWNSWFDQYASFAAHFAASAEALGLDMIVLGGDWVQPALPGGTLSDGQPSGVPADAHLRWEKILTDVDQRFSGSITWVMSLPAGPNPPAYLEHVDQIQLNFSPPLYRGENPGLDQKTAEVENYLDQEVFPFYGSWVEAGDRKLVLRVGYPSAARGSSDCIPDGNQGCYADSTFNQAGIQLPGLERDLMDQAEAYQAVLQAASGRDWISGVVSRGFYAPAVLHDLSISVHGKPAAQVLQSWFGGLSP